MPRLKRSSKKRKSLADIGDMAFFELLIGWREPTSDFDRSRARWLTFDEMREDYLAIRDEFLANLYSHPGPQSVPWIERELFGDDARKPESKI